MGLLILKRFANRVNTGNEAVPRRHVTFNIFCSHHTTFIRLPTTFINKCVFSRLTNANDLPIFRRKKSTFNDNKTEYESWP